LAEAIIMSNISVIITCYREGNLIFDAVNSILAQTLLPLEILLVNDASSDRRTIEVCQELEQNPLVRVIWRVINGGPSVARENGFREAHGEILLPLDADDILPTNALFLIWETFQRYPDAGFVYGNYLRQKQSNSTGKIINPQDISLQSMLKAKNFSLSSNWRLIGTTPLRRSLWQSIGGYDPNFGVEDLHDVEFWIRAIASGCSYQYIPEVIYIWRKYLGSNSRKVTPLSWYRIAQKYLSIYQDLGLAYRAYELLLLGSKWLNYQKEIQHYSQEIKHCIWQGKFQISTLIALGIPTAVLQSLSKQLSQRR
jgi:glycosyltransferase involved in cell wall biosynthesis